MKKSMLFVFASIFLIIVSVAFAGVFEGKVTSLKADKSSLAVKSDDKKEYEFECDKGVIPNSIGIGDKVKVRFEEKGNTKKATHVKLSGGC
jgi:plastocyanin domain-containing protein